CFDTAFHRGHAAVADRYALPDALYQEGVRRYGFHGLSYEYIARNLPHVAPEISRAAVVVAHLGSGASMCAIRDGRSVDSTMGFTALDGLPMGTRCGQLDPGVVLYLLTEKGWSVKDVERLLYRDAGLRGLSGISNDVRDLLASDAAGARLLRLPDRAGDGFPRGGRGRDRRAGADRRHRGELARDPGPGLCPGRVARGRAGRDGQPRGGPAHLDITIPRVGVGDPHRRGAHDRRAHARPRDPSGVRPDDERSPDR